MLVEDGREETTIDELKRLQAVAGIFLQASSHALRGERLPDRLEAQIRYLLG